MDSCDKLVFRLQHLIPHGLASAAPKITNNNSIPLQGPVEPTSKNLCVSSKSFEVWQAVRATCKGKCKR